MTDGETSTSDIGSGRGAAGVTLIETGGCGCTTGWGVEIGLGLSFLRFERVFDFFEGRLTGGG